MVDVRCPGDLPGAVYVRVGLADVSFAEAHIELRRNLPHGSLEIGTDFLIQRRQEKKPFIDVRQRMNRIDIGGQPARRLRLADGDHVPRSKATEHIDALGISNRLSGLRDDVIRQRVVVDRPAVVHIDRAVPCRTELLQCRDADLLRRNTHPDVAGAQHVLPRKEPGILRVETICDVVPLHEHRAVEPFRVCGPPDDDAGLVRMIAVDDASGSLRRRVVAIRRTLNEELLLDVAMHRQIVVRRKETIVVHLAARNAGSGNGAGDARV